MHISVIFYSAVSRLHCSRRLVLTMLPPQTTRMTGTPCSTPFSWSTWPRSPEYTEASTEPHAISTSILWSSANLRVS